MTGVQSSTHNDTTLVISWRPPDDPKGDIMNYSVSIINLGNGNPVRQDNLIDTSLTQTDLGTWKSMVLEGGKVVNIICVYVQNLEYPTM